jgi:hypothetical protein
MFVYSSRGKWVFLLSCGVFLPPPISPAFLLLVAGHAPHPHSHKRLSGLPGLFIYSPGKDSLPPVFSAQGAPPSFLPVLIALIAYYSVSLFNALLSDRMCRIISIFLYLLRLALCSKIGSILEKVPWAAEKNVYCTEFG